MKKMDSTWFYIAIGLVALGSLIGVVGSVIAAFNTKKFRDDSISKQDKIVELNEAIDSAITRIQTINSKIASTQEDISGITGNNFKLAEQNFEISKGLNEIIGNIHVAQTELNKIVTESDSILKYIRDFQTGGDSFGYVEFNYYPIEPDGLVELLFVVRGNLAMKNLNISINSKYPYQGTQLPINKNFKDKADKVLEYSNGFKGKLNYLESYDDILLSSFSPKELNNQIYLSIEVRAANFVTRQTLICTDIENKSPFFTEVKKVTNLKNSERAVLFKDYKNIDELFDDNGNVIYFNE